MLSTLGINVRGLDGVPVAGAVISIVGEEVAITNSAAFSTPGYSKVFTPSGIVRVAYAPFTPNGVQLVVVADKSDAPGRDIIAADVNNDDVFDLLIPGNAEHAVFLGNGDGSFGPELLFAAATIALSRLQILMVMAISMSPLAATRVPVPRRFTLAM